MICQISLCGMEVILQAGVRKIGVVHVSFVLHVSEQKVFQISLDVIHGYQKKRNQASQTIYDSIDQQFPKLLLNLRIDFNDGLRWVAVNGEEQHGTCCPASIRPVPGRALDSFVSLHHIIP